MSKLIAILMLAMWTFHLLSKMAQGVSQWRQDRQSSAPKDESEWEIIEPAEREDGKQVKAQLSRREKARRVFGARVHIDASPLEKNIAQSGMLTLRILVIISLLILVPTLILALR